MTKPTYTKYYILMLSFTRNNFRLSFLHSSGKLFRAISLKELNQGRRTMFTPSVIKNITFFLLRGIKIGRRSKRKPMHLHFKGLGNLKRTKSLYFVYGLLYFLRKLRFKIDNFTNITPTKHNGCKIRSKIHK